MNGWRIRSGTIVLAGMLAEQGCLFKRTPPKASIVIPPAPQAQPPQPLPTPPQLAEPQANSSGAAGRVDGQTPELTPSLAPTLPLSLPPNLPPPPVKPIKPKSAKKNPAVNPNGAELSNGPPQEAPSVPLLVPSPGPSLQPILGIREIQERNQRIQAYLDKARLTILRAERSQQNEQQKQLIAQVKTFLQQAEDSRKVDLMRAENLAERAEVLSRSLVK